MFKYIVICMTAISCSGLGCPMGLGKKYKNKPAFFHPDFYTYTQKSSANALTSQIVAQKDFTTNQIADYSMDNHSIVDHSIVNHSIVDQRRSS